MEKLDQLRGAIDRVLISGVGPDTQIELLIDVMKTHAHCFDSIIIGWLDIYVRAPAPGECIDVRWPNNAVIYERLFTPELEQKMRQRGALWKPAIH